MGDRKYLAKIKSLCSSKIGLRAAETSGSMALKIGRSDGFNGSRSESGRSRKIRPLELFKKGGTLYLTAMCRVRSEERVFRLDRLQLPPEEGGSTTTRKTRSYTLGPSGTTTSSTPAPEPARPPERTAPPAAPSNPSPPPARPVATTKTGGSGCLVLLLPVTILGTLTIGLIGTLVA